MNQIERILILGAAGRDFHVVFRDDVSASVVFLAGSMAPKVVESAIEFVEATARPAVIAPMGGIAAALHGAGGTTIRP